MLNGGGIIGGNYNINVRYEDGPCAQPTSLIRSGPDGASIIVFGGQKRQEALLAAVAAGSPDRTPQEIVDRTWELIDCWAASAKKRKEEELAKAEEQKPEIITN